MTKTYTSQTDANWKALSEEQRDYFRHLASGDPNRSAIQFFKDTVPENIQDDPEKIEVFLNGGTVTTYEWVETQGRASGEYVEVEHTIPDRDWSHDTSRANGGSDSADNGRWEEASTNRARGSRNSTTAEQQAADEATAYDADLLENGDVLKEAEQAADLVAAAEVSELLAVAADVTVDFLAPAVGGCFAAKFAADQFEKTEHKVAAAGVAGLGSAALLCTPVGQAGLAGYLGFKLVRAGWKFFNK